MFYETSNNERVNESLVATFLQKVTGQEGNPINDDKIEDGPSDDDQNSEIEA